eukprot:6478448-Amphidinium_carterae.2
MSIVGESLDADVLLLTIQGVAILPKQDTHAFRLSQHAHISTPMRAQLSLMGVTRHSGTVVQLFPDRSMLVVPVHSTASAA